MEGAGWIVRGCDLAATPVRLGTPKEISRGPHFID